jgi:trk system potassium uptake protein TrkA
MHIVVIGAGAVGSYLAERLSLEGQDVVVIESDPARAAEVQDQIDCLVIRGNGASPVTLQEAGAGNADLVIAVSSSDAVNVLAANAAARLGAKRRIARVEDPRLMAEAEVLGVDFLIDPVDATARELVLLVQQRGVSELIKFADGRLNLTGGYISAEAPVAGMTLADLRTKVEGWTWIVVAVIRDGKTMIARGSTRIEPGDHVLFMVEADRPGEAFRLTGLHEEPARDVTVVGATRLAELTARYLCKAGISTILIDEDEGRVRAIATDNAKVIGVHGDPTDPKVLVAEGIAGTDSILALTGWDEVNILSCLVAKALGVATAVSRFNNPELVHLLAGKGIDAGVSTRLTAASTILRFVRRGNVYSVSTFQDSDAEAIEVEVGQASQAVGKRLRDLHLSHDLIIGGVVRRDKAFVPTGDTEIKLGDHLIIIALPEAVKHVEQLSG